MLRSAALVLLLAVVATGVAVAPASAARRQVRCSSSYGYAGLVGRRPVAGIAADVGVLAVPTVADGHVAAWVGVSAGPSWLQVGISGFAGGATAFYVETARPGVPLRTQLLGTADAARLYAVAVREVHAAGGRWQAFLDGRPVGATVALPHGHPPLLPMAMSESWNGGTASCNGFSFVFDGVRVAPRVGGPWQRLAHAASRVDPGYRLRVAGTRVIAKSTG